MYGYVQFREEGELLMEKRASVESQNSAQPVQEPCETLYRCVQTYKEVTTVHKPVESPKIQVTI